MADLVKKNPRLDWTIKPRFGFNALKIRPRFLGRFEMRDETWAEFTMLGW